MTQALLELTSCEVNIENRIKDEPDGVLFDISQKSAIDYAILQTLD